MSRAESAPPIGLEARHWAIVRDILQRHVPGTEIWAFGSRARGTAGRYSDLDLAVVAPVPLDFRTRGALAEAFTDSDLPWTVDLLDWAATDEAFRRIVLRDRVVLIPAGP